VALPTILDDLQLAMTNVREHAQNGGAGGRIEVRVVPDRRHVAQAGSGCGHEAALSLRVG
jgi:hypothetical protein